MINLNMAENIIIWIMFLIVEGVAVLLLREFVISHNGRLRILMIWYFAIEIWVYLVFFVLLHNVPQSLTYVILALIPKSIVKLNILYYLKGTNKRP
jgi:hypothetical protein